jgi:hypothetical protein
MGGSFDRAEKRLNFHVSSVIEEEYLPREFSRAKEIRVTSSHGGAEKGSQKRGHPLKVRSKDKKSPHRLSQPNR